MRKRLPIKNKLPKLSLPSLKGLSTITNIFKRAGGKGASGKTSWSWRYTIIVFLLVTSALATFFTFVVVNRDAYKDSTYTAITGDVRVLIQDIVLAASKASNANVEEFANLKKTRDSLDKRVNQLIHGDPARDLPKLPVEVAGQLAEIDGLWQTFKDSSDTILLAEGTIRQLDEFVNHINNTMPNLLALSDDVVQIMIEIGANPQQVYTASRQLMLSQRMSFNVNKMLQGGHGAATAADRFGRDAALFGRVLEAMLKGNEVMVIRRIQDPDAREKLEEVAETYGEISELVGRILEKTPQLFKAHEAAATMLDKNNEFARLTDALLVNIGKVASRRILSAGTGSLLAVLVGVSLLLLLGQLYRDSQDRVRFTELQNKTNQESIMQLLEEIADLADGDLTRHATVTETFTGAIADAINFAIDALRKLVDSINETTVQVSSAAQESQATAMHLAEASDHQAQQITAVSQAVNDMAQSIEDVSQNASRSAEVAKHAVTVAHKGSLAVQDTINGMDTIRETIQETSKRIKRLGESSQEIGDIIELINDIADQTNILALNAAIQAAMAGEAGRGFAVVADEVQRLAERSTDATKQIEGLVRTIQSDTQEAVASMEQSTAGVVKGANLAQNAGAALNEIEETSNRMARIIQTISDSAQQQSSAAVNISETMNMIQEITTQTSTGTNETATSIGNLADLANELRTSVAGFKLPA